MESQEGVRWCLYTHDPVHSSGPKHYPHLRAGEHKRGKVVKTQVPFTSNYFVYEPLMNPAAMSYAPRSNHRRKLRLGISELDSSWNAFSDFIHSGLCEWGHCLLSHCRLRKVPFLLGTILKSK